MTHSTQPLVPTRCGLRGRIKYLFNNRHKNIFHYGGEIRKIEKHAHFTHTEKKHDTEKLSLRKLSPEKVCLASAHTD